METKIKIIGFSGKLGTGKNYIAENLVGKKMYELGYNIHFLAFGDQVKYELGSRLNLIEDKDISMGMNDVYEKLFINKTADIRKKLQYYATDYCRNGGNWNIKEDFTMYNQPNIWIKGLYLQIKNILSKSYNPNNDVFIITDIRFKNEAEFIKSLGGQLFRINAPTRNLQKINEEALKNTKTSEELNEFIERIKNHSSETNLDDYKFDYYINNEPDNNNVKEEIEKIIYNI
jgi:hypothetical protein